MDGGAGVWQGAHEGSAEGRRDVYDGGLIFFLYCLNNKNNNPYVIGDSSVIKVDGAVFFFLGQWGGEEGGGKGRPFTCRIMPSVWPWPVWTSSAAQKCTGRAAWRSAFDIVVFGGQVWVRGWMGWGLSTARGRVFSHGVVCEGTWGALLRERRWFIRCRYLLGVASTSCRGHLGTVG